MKSKMSKLKQSSKADLHMHSTKSDGGYSPVELMQKCVEAGLTLVALTDHDTTAGVLEAQEFAEKNNITLIPGIELSTRDRSGVSVDILGYGIDPQDKKLLDTISYHQKMRVNRMELMIEKCHELNIQVSFDDVKQYAKGDTFSRPHLAKVLVNKGYVNTVKEAFDNYLGQGKPCNVSKHDEMSPEEAIKLIHHAGGMAVVAHPIFYDLDDTILEWLTREGLDGIEVYHRDHDDNAIKRFNSLARKAEQKLNKPILKTGGSDFHHESFGREGERIGVTKLPFKEAENLVHILSKNN